MERSRDIEPADALLVLLERRGWAVGPSGAGRAFRFWARRVASPLGFTLTAGFTQPGRPWVARTDLDDEAMYERRVPWYLLDVSPKSFFFEYGEHLEALLVPDRPKAAPERRPVE